MTRSNENLTTQLLDLDTATEPAELRAQYERRMTELFDRKLTFGDWAKVALMFVGGLTGAVVCGALAISEPAETSSRTRAILAILALIGLSWVGLAGLLIRRRSIHSAVHGTAAATMGFAFSLIAMALIGVIAMVDRRGFGLILLPLVPLVLATVVLLVHHIKQAELRIRRDLLSIGHRLARTASVQARDSA